MPDERIVASMRQATGGHVTVQLRGFGTPGSRPLLGEVVCTWQEWAWLRDRLPDVEADDGDA